MNIFRNFPKMIMRRDEKVRIFPDANYSRYPTALYTSGYITEINMRYILTDGFDVISCKRVSPLPISLRRKGAKNHIGRCYKQ